MSTLIKRSWKNKTKSMTVDYGVSYMENGKQKKEYGCRTKEEQAELFNTITDQLKKYGKVVIDKKLSFEDMYYFYINDYIKIYKRDKPRTLTDIERIYNNHLKAFFSKLYVINITKQTIYNFLAMQQDKDLSPKTINNHLILIKAIFSYAFKNDKIYRNPAEKIPALKYKKKEMRVLEEHERKLFLEKAKELANKNESLADAYDILATYLLAGLRLSELPALEWSNISFNDDDIYINKQVYKGQLFTPKSESSIRHVDMCSDLKSILKRRYENRKSDKWVFSAPKGGLWDVDNLKNRLFRPVRDSMQVDYFRLHDLRHTFVSMLIAKGADPKYVSEQAGHFSVSFTLDTYAHIFKKRNKKDHVLNGTISQEQNYSEFYKLQSAFNKLEEISNNIENIPEILKCSIQDLKLQILEWNLTIEKEKIKKHNHLKLVVNNKPCSYL